jgi:glycosyltransferase involved in cell wall biosynthesis
MKSVLLITHDTSLSGAPKSILLVFEQLVKDYDYSITTVTIKGGGKLEDRFKKISVNYYRLDTLSKTINYTFFRRVRKKIFKNTILSSYDYVINEISSENYDCIYCNTIVSLSIGIVFKRKIGCKFILHVHELKTVIDEFCVKLNSYDCEIDYYVVPSELNKKCLIENYDIPIQKIEIIRETSDFQIIDGSKIHQGDTINVLMCGGAYWRKGDDLFLILANTILKKDERFRFFWVGYQSAERRRVNEADINKLKINKFVSFIDETENPYEWYRLAHIFVLTSREDPFPLAAIDAGLFGLPIFCFDKSTGIAEVIDSRCVVPYLDIEAMCQSILSVVNDRKFYNSLILANKLTFNKFTPKLISKFTNDLIEL